jgi:hypothetical protein
MVLTIWQMISLSAVVLLAVLLIMLTAISAWSFWYKLTLIIAIAVGLLSLFYFFNKRNPEAAARRRLAFSLLTIGSSAIGWAFCRAGATVSIFGQNVVLSAGDDPHVLEQGGLFLIAVVAMLCATRLLCVPRPVSSSVLLGEDWLEQLQSRSGPSAPAAEPDLHTRISDDFAINSVMLAKRYVEPDCQPQNPANYNEDNPFTEFRKPVHDFLNHFLHKAFVEKDGSHVLFVLSDAGMGKSSLLVMLKLTHLSKRFWPADTEVTLLKLKADTMEQIKAAANKAKTVLLLDALDEDPTAYGRVSERLAEILQDTIAFRQVIITVRTQFFPGGAPHPLESAGTVDVAGYRCSLVYLSPFSDAQVEQYLQKIFPNNIFQASVKWLCGRDNAKLTRARQIVIPMKSLRMRPMLLAHIERLMEASVESWDEYSVYAELVGRWLQRESRKKTGVREDDLRLACEYLAVRLQQRGARAMTAAELDRLCKEQPGLTYLTAIDIGGRSLLNRTSDGEWRFSHYTVQEFLVVSAFQAKRQFVQERGERLRGTDQILRFVMEMGYKSKIPEGLRNGVDWRAVRVGEELGKLRIGASGKEWRGLAIVTYLLPEGEEMRLRVAPEETGEAAREVTVRRTQGGGWAGVELREVTVTEHTFRRSITVKQPTINIGAPWEGKISRCITREEEGGEGMWIKGEEVDTVEVVAWGRTPPQAQANDAEAP